MKYKNVPVFKTVLGLVSKFRYLYPFVRYTRFSKKKGSQRPPHPPPSPAPTIRQGIGEFSPTAPFQLEKNLQHAPHLVAAGTPLLLGLRCFSLNLRVASSSPARD